MKLKVSRGGNRTRPWIVKTAGGVVLAGHESWCSAMVFARTFIRNGGLA